MVSSSAWWATEQPALWCLTGWMASHHVAAQDPLADPLAQPTSHAHSTYDPDEQREDPGEPGSGGSDDDAYDDDYDVAALMEQGDEQGLPGLGGEGLGAGLRGPAAAVAAPAAEVPEAAVGRGGPICDCAALAAELQVVLKGMHTALAAAEPAHLEVEVRRLLGSERR